jgi:preprotein translocase subunit SecA
VPVIVDSILRAGEGKTLRQLKRISEQINSVEDEFVAMSDDELQAMTEEFRQRYADGETLDELLPESVVARRRGARSASEPSMFS